VDGGIPSFYVSLNIHDKVLHNAMFDSSASHNLMPNSVMERLDLDITRPYKDLFSFDSSQVRCLGLIKDLCVSLVQYLAKTILWAKIGQSITNQWQSIQTIHEQIELISMAQFETQRARASLGNMPEQANRMIQFLNAHTKE